MNECKSIVLLHFQPIELYPPVVNIARYLSESYDVIILTTENQGWSLDLSEYQIEVIRSHGTSDKTNRFQRLFRYLSYHLNGFKYLLTTNNVAVMYFERISSFAVYLYNLFVNRNARIYIHYHEYSSPMDQKSEMLVVRFFHYLERGLYNKASWISHTNFDRLKLFARDEGLDLGNAYKVMPNYPPSSWKKFYIEKPNDKIIRVVHVGALSLQTMFLKELVVWLNNQKGNLICDFYSTNVPEDAHYFINNTLKYGEFKGSVKYDDLPKILSEYHVGLILYKGHIDNYIYNAPNKFFEYLAVGLDIWFPKEMKGMYPYINEQSKPRVLKVDYNNLHCFKPYSAYAELLPQSTNNDYFCEEVYAELVNHISNRIA